MINFNRYVDCGNGVIEHTAVHHNNMGSDKNLMRLDAPFGSVRFSKLRDVVVTDATSEILIKPHELGRYDLTPKKFAAADSMGYAIFAEDLPSPLSGPYPLTAGLSYTIHDVGCRNAPDYVSVSNQSIADECSQPKFSNLTRMLILWFLPFAGISGGYVQNRTDCGRPIWHSSSCHF